jgi:outer membrane protein assembly factor BamB
LHNGRLYVRDGVSDYLFDSQTGSLLSTFSSPVENAPAFSGNLGFFLHGAVRFGELTTLEARDQSNNNALVWSFTGDGYLQSGLLNVNNILYVGSDRGKLYGLDITTGQVVWSTTAGNSIPYPDEYSGGRPTTGLAAAEGLLVIPTNTTLVAYEEDHTPPSVTWSATKLAVK